MSILDRFRGTRHETHEREYDERHDGDGERRTTVAPAGPAPETVRARQHDEYGGVNWGAAFFGWLVAIGLGALLTALLSAAGTAIAISEFQTAGDARGSVEEITLAGGIALLAVALIAYFAGGYVAGRMSRFDGARQGVAVWLWSILAAVILAVLGAVAGEEYNLFAALDLPRIPVDEGDLTTGGIIALIVIVLGTLIAAVLGGKAGEAYHRRVDRAGYRESEAERRRVEEHRAHPA